MITLYNCQKEIFGEIPNLKMNKGTFYIGETANPEDIKHFNAKQRADYRKQSEKIVRECKEYEQHLFEYLQKFKNRKRQSLVPEHLDMLPQYNKQFDIKRTY